MSSLFTLVFLGSIVGIWYFIKKQPNQKYRNYSIIALVVSMLLIGVTGGKSGDEAKKEESKVEKKKTIKEGSTENKKELPLEVASEFSTDKDGNSVITGKTEPGSKIQIGFGVKNKPVESNEKGEFSIDFKLSKPKEDKINILVTKDSDRVSQDVIIKPSDEFLASASSGNNSDDSKNGTKYAAGTYKVGEKIPAGDYKVYAKGAMSYVELASDSSGQLDSIMTNENLSGFMYLTINDGNYLKLNSAYAVPVAEAKPYELKNGKYTDGQYKVGFDIPAGKYEVTAKKDMGYVEVSNAPTGQLEDISTNEIIEQNTFITVSDGQYLKITGAYINAK